MRKWLQIMPLLLIMACSHKDSVPSNIIPQKKMKALMWDLMRADQFLGNYVFLKDTSVNKITESLKYYEQIFAIHEVTRDQFRESFSYYRARPPLFKAIMDSINAPNKAPTEMVSPIPGAAPDTGLKRLQ